MVSVSCASPNDADNTFVGLSFSSTSRETFLSNCDIVLLQDPLSMFPLLAVQMPRYTPVRCIGSNSRDLFRFNQ
jgi:hypothetical protein